MDTASRRKFLVASGVAAGGALAAGYGAVSVWDLFGAAWREPLGDASVLVLVTLYGGNDGLNTLVPAGDKAYQDARPDLAYREDDVLPLGDGLGLNPAMKGFKQLWDDRKLAVVRGVSYPKPDHSHFKSMAIWQTASPGTSVPTGWLGRWLDATGADPLRAIAIDKTLPPLLAGEKVAGAALPLTGPAVKAGALRPALVRLARTEPGEHPLQARAATSLADLLEVDDKLGEVPLGADDEDDDRPSDGNSAGGQGKLGQQLDVVARLVAAGVPTRAYSVSLGGFDTHANEKGTQSQLLGQLDAAVSGFLKKVAKSPHGRNVVVAVYSEFGRRVAANANQGTDHGTAGPLFVAGDAVRGGFHGDQPSLTDLDAGDLKVTTDFRDVYATLLERVLDTDAAKILGNHKGRTPFL